MMRFRGLVLLLATAMVLGGCLGGPAKTTPTTSSPTTTTTSHMMMAPMNKTMVPQDTPPCGAPPNMIFCWKPPTVSVMANMTVNFILSNPTGNNPALTHSFVIEKMNFKIAAIGPGMTKNATIVFTQPGTYKYYCDVGSHRSQGLEGTLTVT